MSIDDESELEALRAAGRVVRLALDAMSAAVAPGVSTAQLDAIAGEIFRAHGARSAPRLVYDFPGQTCISVNDEIVHGIPSARRVLADGDLVKLDVTVEKDGFRRPLPKPVELYALRRETLKFDLSELPESVATRMRAEGKLLYEGNWVDPEQAGVVEFNGIVMKKDVAFRLEQIAKGLVEY